MWIYNSAVLDGKCVVLGLLQRRENTSGERERDEIKEVTSWEIFQQPNIPDMIEASLAVWC